MKSKICGISDSKTLEYLTKHSNPPQYIGFIVNYPKSKRFVQHDRLKELLKVDKKDSKYVAVLVQPDEHILAEIKDLPFDIIKFMIVLQLRLNRLKKNIIKKLLLR